MTSTQKHHKKVATEDITGEVHTVLKNLSNTSYTSRHGDKISELVQVMNSVKTDTTEAKANETSMSDNNGKRIKYKSNKPHHN